MANGVLGLVIGVITTLVVDMAFIVQVLSSELMLYHISNLTFAAHLKFLVGIVAFSFERNSVVILMLALLSSATMYKCCQSSFIYDF